MLLIPFDRAIDWRHPPIITLALVLTNVLLFFGWQAGEDAALAQASQFYRSSGLAAIEAPAYIASLKERGDPLPEGESTQPSLWQAVSDAGFRDRLQRGRVVPADDPRYPRWQRDRARLQQMLQQVTFLEYGLKPADPTLASLFAHMFLHADLGHLLGNMFFLFAVGFLVEAAIGRWAFLGCYLIGGLGSAGLDLLLSPDRLIPGIGASGAIAGLMGLYAVLYWTRPVRFFYFLLVYFDYVKLPAIALLPLWIGNELYQIWQHGDSGINYIAHLGGLCSGALIGALVRGRLPSYSLEHCDQADRRAEFQQRLGQARSLCRDLDYQKALPILRRLHSDARTGSGSDFDFDFDPGFGSGSGSGSETGPAADTIAQPDRREALCLYQQALRLAPSSDEYHRINQHILALPLNDRATRTLVLETLGEYSNQARPAPRINQKTLCRLAPLLIEDGHLDTGRRVFRTLLRHQWPCPQAAATLASLIPALEAAGQNAEASAFRALLAHISRNPR